ncbi:RidA family protein [Cupriavidus necator]
MSHAAVPSTDELVRLIEIVWKHAKYHWRRFVTRTKETIDDEISQLLGAYGSTFEVRFLLTLNREFSIFMMKKYLISLAIGMFSVPLLTFANPKADVEAGSTVKFVEPVPAGYSKYVEVDLGNARMIILSGQVSMDPQGNVVGKNDVNRQLEYVFSEIKHTLERAGGTMNHLIKINNYFVDLSDVSIFRRVRDKYVNRQVPPASTTMEVRRFVNSDILVEIEAMAIIPKKSS